MKHKYKLNLNDTFTDSTETSMELSQPFFDDIDILSNVNLGEKLDNGTDEVFEKDTWYAWKLISSDDEYQHFDIISTEKTSELCFRAVELYYDNLKITPKKLKSTKINFYDISYQRACKRISNTLSEFYGMSSDMNLKYMLNKIKTIESELKLCLRFQLNESHWNYKDDFNEKIDWDESTILSQVDYLSDRWNAIHRLIYLLKVIGSNLKEFN